MTQALLDLFPDAISQFGLLGCAWFAVTAASAGSLFLVISGRAVRAAWHWTLYEIALRRELATYRRNNRA